MKGLLRPGDPAPWFVQRATSRADYHFDTVAGRYILLCFFGSAAEPETRRMIDELWAQQDLFDDETVAFFGVSSDPDDERQCRLREKLPGFRVFWDFDLKVAGLFGLLQQGAGAGGQVRIARVTYVLDPALRVMAVLPLQDPRRHALEIVAAVKALPRIAPPALEPAPAPVLLVSRVFEPAFCRQLIDYYGLHGGDDSGYMREDGGKTLGVIDHGRKRRRDREIEDEALRAGIRQRLKRRLDPEIARAFCFVPTRMERYIVACYDAEEGGYFLPHRDNTTKGTAHRRFAVTINLNAEEYSGGDLRFPEYGSSLYRAPTGGAIVFSCSLLHEARPVTRGRRYACLPFLYDEAAAEIRLRNLDHIADEKLREEVRATIVPPAVPRRH